MNTVLITGCSSGYGLETARHPHSQGWNVIATMRTPRADVLPQAERLRVLALDVTKPESIAAALEASGPIDVLVNNAGIGAIGAFEATPIVAEAVWRAANDASGQLRFAAGPDAVALAQAA
jgi:NAD(P)-dependent dehydrogenase (short-subunit alcohol dehydrogenase family)